jgi:hypothetical protein
VDKLSVLKVTQIANAISGNSGLPSTSWIVRLPQFECEHERSFWPKLQQGWHVFSLKGGHLVALDKDNESNG